jgi:tripartite-type tricarboxylate transporter receptor subunit TctC
MKAVTRSIFGAILLFAHQFAVSQDFPDRPVRLVVVDPPGSAVDVVARILTEHLNGQWPQKTIVENRPGASGTIAANQVAKSKPDGYAYLMTGTFTEAIVPFAMQNMPYDYKKDLVPVAEVARLPFVLVSPAGSTLRTLKDVQALGKTKPSGVTVGGMPRGSSLHLTWEVIAQQMGIPSVYVAYNGGHQLQSDLVGGQLDIAIDTISSARPFIQQGRTNGLAATSRARSAALPEVPTLDENGLKGMEVIVWVGIMAPNGTPANRLSIVERAMIEAARSDLARTRLAESGYIVTGATGAELAETIRQDRARFEPVVRRLGLKMN